MKETINVATKILPVRRTVKHGSNTATCKKQKYLPPNMKSRRVTKVGGKPWVQRGKETPSTNFTGKTTKSLKGRGRPPTDKGGKLKKNNGNE